MKEFVEVGGLRIAYERAGRGPALVLLHGFVADGASTWSGQLDGLSDEFTAPRALVLAAAYAGWPACG